MTIEIASFSQLVYKLYLGAAPKMTWEPFLAELAEHLQCKAAVLVLQSPGATTGGMISAHGAVSERTPNYLAQFIALDPLVNLHEGQIVTLQQYLGATDILKTDFYRHCLAPAGLFHALGVDLKDERRYIGRLRLARDRECDNFSPGEQALLTQLLPHIKAALNIRFEVDSTLLERMHYADAMDRLEMATVILDEGGRVIHTSPLAESLLSARDGVHMAKDCLAFDSRDDSKTFKEIVRRCLEARSEGRPAAGEVMRVRRARGTDLSIIVRPHGDRATEERTSVISSVAVFVHAESDEETRSEIAPSNMVQKLFGLTPKEAVLALRLASGRTLQEAAEDLGISQGTARAHLRSIFAKTGIDRQTKLVRALLKSVAMLGL